VPVSASSKAPARALGAGEGAALVAEQLGLDERLGQAAAVDHHERIRLALAVTMDLVGDHVLARAGLALQEHRRVAGGDARQEVEQPAHRRALADERAEAVAVGEAEIGLLALDGEGHLDVADEQARLGRQIHLHNANAVEKGSVGRVEIREQVAVAVELDACVEARDRRLRDGDGVALVAAQGDRVFGAAVGVRLAPATDGDLVDAPLELGDPPFPGDCNGVLRPTCGHVCTEDSTVDEPP
jgi:hypothetical protein